MPATTNAQNRIIRSGRLSAYSASRSPAATAELFGCRERSAADLALIFRNTHPDYRGIGHSGPTILVLREGVTTVVPLAALSDREFAERVAAARQREARS